MTIDSDVGAGVQITVVVTDAAGAPAVGAGVEVNDVDVGVTGAKGTLVVTIAADAENAEIDVNLGDAEGEIKVEF